MILPVLLSAAMQAEVVQPWHYLTLGLSAVLAEEPAAVIGGFGAAEGRLHLGWAVAACTLLPWTKAALLYALGRWQGNAVRKRLGKLRRPFTRALVLIRRRPATSIFIVRFGWGMRIAMPLACGAARVRMVPYLLGTLLVAFAWSVVFTLLGYLFGASAVRVLGRAEELKEWLVPALVVAVLVGWFVVRVRAHMREEEERMLRGEGERR